jgi:O-acetyl-ADP-ribose deacetylase (regulator of RNase III)
MPFMIHYINGDLFTSKADALINPVNCAGVMGAGLAKEFRDRYPECVKPYKEACAANALRPGILMFCAGEKEPSIIMFPTKDHWRGKSRLEWIAQGLRYLQDHYRQWSLKFIAMPQIGCGLGGLQWEDVSALVNKRFGNEELDIDVYVNAVSKYEFEHFSLSDCSSYKGLNEAGLPF